MRTAPPPEPSICIASAPAPRSSSTVSSTVEAVRIVASTAFVDGPAGITVDGVLLTGSFTISVIGPGPTMRTALTIPGGVSDAVARVGGTVIVDEPASVTVDALHASTELRYAKPAD